MLCRCPVRTFHLSETLHELLKNSPWLRFVTMHFQVFMSEVVFAISFWLPRLPVPDMSPKSQPTVCDQRKDLALRRTGETPLPICVCDEGSRP